jgi:PAS domain-containing protein
LADEQRETGPDEAPAGPVPEPYPGGGGARAPLESPAAASASLDERRIRVLDELMREVPFQVDAQGSITWLTKPWERLTGMLVSRWLGRPLWEAFHPEDRERARALLESAAAQRSLAPREELRLEAA